jgi:primosomal protein N' (replication factor Y)
LLRRAVSTQRQGILFLNRRGYATSVFCQRCATTLSCTRCSVSLTYHRRHGTVLCHPCGEERPAPTTCPGCGSPGLARLGAGTERLEDALRAAVPGVRFARMDSDVMHDRASYEDVLTRFGRGDLDVLVGTQMIAKGLHFPRVSVVGVVSADSSLLVPDFRAAERTFQLVSQVAGRAGRGERGGHVVVQTVQPQHAAFAFAAAHDFRGFAERETAERRRYLWPPFVRLVRVVVTGRDEDAARSRAETVAAGARSALPHGGGSVLGPAPCPILRIKDRFRWHLVVKTADEPVQRALVMRLARFSRRAGGTDLTIDVDPADLT